MNAENTPPSGQEGPVVEQPAPAVDATAPEPACPCAPEHVHAPEGNCTFVDTELGPCQCIRLTDEEKKFQKHIDVLIRQLMDASVRGDIGLHDQAFSRMLLTFSDPEQLKEKKAAPPWVLPDELQRIILFTGMRLVKQVLVGSGAYGAYMKRVNDSKGGLTDAQGNPISRSALRA